MLNGLTLSTLQRLQMGRDALGSGATGRLTSNPRASGEWVTTGDHSPTWTRGQGLTRERFACGRDLRPFNQNMQGGLKVERYNMTVVARSFEAFILLWVCITVHNCCGQFSDRQLAYPTWMSCAFTRNYGAIVVCFYC